jgi:hypothetical protein
MLAREIKSLFRREQENGCISDRRGAIKIVLFVPVPCYSIILIDNRLMRNQLSLVDHLLCLSAFAVIAAVAAFGRPDQVSRSSPVDSSAIVSFSNHQHASHPGR